MGLEVPTYVNDLVDTNPGSTDLRSQGDDHLRAIKTALKNTFPGASKPFYFNKSETINSNTTLTAADSNALLVLNANGGNFNLTLPEDLDTEDEGWMVYLVRSDDSANEVTIIGTVSGFEDPKLIGEGLPVIIAYSGSAFYLVGPPNLDITDSMSAANSTPVGRSPATCIEITGNTNISSFGKGMAGQRRTLIFTGSPTLVHSNNLVCFGNTDIDITADSRAEVTCLGGEVWIVTYARNENGESL